MKQERDTKNRFSDKVKDYIQYRPSYPKEIIDFIFNNLGMTNRSTIADVGSGTGIFTQLLLERGAKVYAVEPNLEMRLAAESLLEKYKNFYSVPNAAEETGLQESSIDMVCSATAFHWFDADLVKKEWKRILRPGGLVFLVWNLRKETSPFLLDYESMLHHHGTDYLEIKNKTAENSSGMDILFSSSSYKVVTYPNQQVFDYEGLKGRLLSCSYVPAPKDESFAPMLAELRRIFDRHQINGQVKFEYDCKAYYGVV